MKDHAMFRSSALVLVMGVVALVMLGCRTVPERSALAQVPDGGDDRGSTAEAAGEGLPGVSVRRVWAGTYTEFYASSISPDGRYLSMIDWATGNLAVRDLSTGEVHRVTNVHNEEGKPWGGPGVSLFSPDGRRMLSSWQYGSSFQLRGIDFELDAAGVPRVAEPVLIFDNPELNTYYVLDVSPDGSQVLATLYTAGNNHQLALISTSDGTYRVLRSFDWREADRAAFSPDGRYVAYDFQPDQDSPEADVFVVSVDGAYEAKVVDHAGLFGWHPSGSILFGSNRDGTPGIWRIPMSDGRPAGPAELVGAEIGGVWTLGFAEGRFYYGIEVDPLRLYTVTMDAATGKQIGAPVPVEDPRHSRIRGWDWSADGKFFAYSGSDPGGSRIVIRSDRGEVGQTIHVDLRPTRHIRWDPDGRSLIVFANDGKGRPGFHRIDLEAGSYTTILRNNELADPTPRGHFDISPDGRKIWFVTSAEDEVRWTLIAYDLESGTLRSITPVEWRVRADAMSWLFGQISVSPDGSELAVVAPDTASGDPWIGTIPVEGGSFTPLARLDGRFFLNPEWTADGRSIIVWTGLPLQWTGWLVPTDGGKPRRLELKKHVFPRAMKVHPDGRRIAFLSGELRGEVWVMEGLGTAAASENTSGSSR